MTTESLATESQNAAQRETFEQSWGDARAMNAINELPVPSAFTPAISGGARSALGSLGPADFSPWARVSDLSRFRTGYCFHRRAT